MYIINVCFIMIIEIDVYVLWYLKDKIIIWGVLVEINSVYDFVLEDFR